MNDILSFYLLQFSILHLFRKINYFLPTTKLFGCLNFRTVTWHLMAIDALSAIVLIVAVNQLPMNIVVVDKGAFSNCWPPLPEMASPTLLGCFYHSSTVLTPCSCCL